MKQLKNMGGFNIMHTFISKSVVVLLAILFIPYFLHSQAGQEDPHEVQTYKYGVGFQGTFPASGLSGMMNITDEIAIQAIAGFFGTLRTFSGRGLYKFQQEDFWDLCGYGILGAWSPLQILTRFSQSY